MFDPQVVAAVSAPVVAFVAGMVVDHKFNVCVRVVAFFAGIRNGFHAKVAVAEAKVEAVRSAVSK